MEIVLNGEMKPMRKAKGENKYINTIWLKKSTNSFNKPQLNNFHRYIKQFPDVA